MPGTATPSPFTASAPIETMILLRYIPWAFYFYLIEVYWLCALQ